MWGTKTLTVLKTEGLIQAFRDLDSGANQWLAQMSTQPGFKVEHISDLEHAEHVSRRYVYTHD